MDNELASELRAVISRLIKKLRKGSVTGQQLSQTERSTVALLYKHGQLLPTELANMEMITRQSMSQVLSHLFELGYITRTTSETDKRKISIALTTEGERILLQVLNERDEWLAKAIEQTCSSEEQELLKKAIGPLSKIIEFE